VNSGAVLDESVENLLAQGRVSSTMKKVTKFAMNYIQQMFQAGEKGLPGK
jgi:hypothetical protein